MSELRDFHERTHGWLRENAPASLYGTRKGRFDGYWGGQKGDPPSADVQAWFELMLERGYTAPRWPKRYGGAELSDAEADVLEQLLRELKLPPPLVGFGLTMIGPTLLDYGSDEQKAEHIPRIVRGEVRWCQGYSEPGAGSDLAGLSTRAVIDGDQLVIDGQKIWTSYADVSDWIFCLVRTNTEVKKQAGITFVLVDMGTAGVSTRRIQLISGASPFCETFFDAVRVPLANVVGEIDGGWTVAKALLGYERSMIGEAIGGQLTGVEDELVALARRELGCETGELGDPLLRDEIVRVAMDEQCFAFARERLRQSLAEGSKPGPEASIAKVTGSEQKQRRFELAVRIAGQRALGWEGPGYEADELQLTRDWLRSRAATIEGGTSEIQLNIIAKRVLGLG